MVVEQTVFRFQVTIDNSLIVQVWNWGSYNKPCFKKCQVSRGSNYLRVRRQSALRRKLRAPGWRQSCPNHQAGGYGTVRGLLFLTNVKNFYFDPLYHITNHIPVLSVEFNYPFESAKYPTVFFSFNWKYQNPNSWGLHRSWWWGRGARRPWWRRRIRAWRQSAN